MILLTTIAIIYQWQVATTFEMRKCAVYFALEKMQYLSAFPVKKLSGLVIEMMYAKLKKNTLAKRSDISNLQTLLDKYFKNYENPNLLLKMQVTKNLR